MSKGREVDVVLSEGLWRSLSRQAAELGVPLELLAAGLVCDTMQAVSDTRTGSPASAVRRADPPSRGRRPRTWSHLPVRTVRN